MHTMLSTHILAVTELTHAALPGMIRNKNGTIINVSSLAAFIPGISRSLYLGTKAYIHFFTESLKAELSGLGIRLQSLCPGMTHSDFHSRFDQHKVEKKLTLIPFMTAVEVVTTSLRYLDKGLTLCIPGLINKVFYVIARLLPTSILSKISGFRKEDPVVAEEPGERYIIPPHTCPLYTFRHAG